MFINIPWWPQLHLSGVVQCCCHKAHWALMACIVSGLQLRHTVMLLEARALSRVAYDFTKPCSCLSCCRVGTKYNTLHSENGVFVAWASHCSRLRRVYSFVRVGLTSFQLWIDAGLMAAATA